MYAVYKELSQKIMSNKIDWSEKDFIFNIESTGALPITKIVEQAAIQIGEKASELSSLIKNLE